MTAGSAFAFDMFVKPQLSKPLTDFVTWHATWWIVAYLLSAATSPVVRTGAGRGAPARIAAIGYLVAIGAVSLWLTGRPYLAFLAGGALDLVVVPGALIPIVWLSVIDHLSAIHSDDTTAPPRHAQRALLRTAIATPLLLWLAHLVQHGLDTAAGPATLWMVGAAWALLLSLCAFQLGMPRCPSQPACQQEGAAIWNTPPPWPSPPSVSPSTCGASSCRRWRSRRWTRCSSPRHWDRRRADDLRVRVAAGARPELEVSSRSGQPFRTFGRWSPWGPGF